MKTYITTASYNKEVEEELQELVRLGSTSAKQALKYIKTKEGKESLAEYFEDDLISSVAVDCFLGFC